MTAREFILAFLDHNMDQEIIFHDIVSGIDFTFVSVDQDIDGLVVSVV